MRLLIVSIATAASLAVFGLCPAAANAQGISIGPGGVGIDTGIDLGRGYRNDRGDGEYRHHRDRRDYGDDRRRLRDHHDGRDYGYRRHRHEEFEQDSEQ